MNEILDLNKTQVIKIIGSASNINIIRNKLHL